MSFQPFDFVYTPPRTVASQPQPLPTTLSVPTGPTVGSPTSGAQSVAGEIISQLDDLTAMSQYLQDAIVARTSNTAIQIDPAVDPDTARALVSIYGTDTPPTYITVQMYDKLLDAHFGALQLEMAVGNDSAIAANPYQVGDLMKVIGTVNTHLTNSPSFNNWLPLQLASLKGDTIIFQSWKAALQSYPAYYSTPTIVPENYQPSALQASSMDINPDLAAYEQSVTLGFSRSYSNTYLMMATTGPVDGDINNVLNTYLDQPLANVLRIVACLNALISLTHKQTMSDIQTDVSNYSFARLGADVSASLHTTDQLVQMAVSPLFGGLGALSSIVSAVQNQAATVGRLTSGVMTGMSVNNPCAQSNPSLKVAGASAPLTVPGLGIVSAGLQSLGEHLEMAMNKVNESFGLINLSFQQIMQRRMKATNGTNQLMCSIKAIVALIAAASAVAAAYKNGTVSPAAPPQAKQAAVNSILTSLQTGSNTTFVANGNQVVVNPPDMPPVTTPVQNVLSRAKIHTTLGRIQA